MRIIQPPAAKVFWAFFVASLVAATPSLLAGMFAVYLFPFAFMIALGHALLLGAPLYYLLRRRFPIGWAAAMIAGAAVGAVPLGATTIYLQLMLSNDLFGHEWIIMNWPTLAFAAVMGFIAGTIFRAVLGAPQIEPEVDPSIFE